MTKLSKHAAGYILRSNVDYFCKECAYFSDRDKCSMYVPGDATVSPYGACTLWEDLREGAIDGNHSRTRQETAYEENRAGFGCKRCEEFIIGKNLCKKVSPAGPPAPDTIHPDGCCNLWEKDPIRGGMTSNQLVQLLPSDRPDTGALTGLFRTVSTY